MKTKARDNNMTAKSQQQDEMVNAFVASIPTMQTDIALLKQDTAILKDASITQSIKADTIIKSIGDISVVTKKEFAEHVKDGEKWKEEQSEYLDKRFKQIEDYLANSKPGINFSNALVSRWTTFLVLLLLTGAVVIIVSHFVPNGA